MKKHLTLILLSFMTACAPGNTPQPSESPDTLKWYSTCGDPVCRPDAPMSENTCGENTEGQTCSEEGASCDPGSHCGSKLICADSDPKLQPGGCPISLRSSKTAINYLGETQRRALAKELMAIQLAQYAYKSAPEQRHLGFIIDDLPAHSPAVLPNGKQVDIYGYLSMAVASLQAQDQKIQSLEQRLQILEAKLQTLK